MKQGFAQLALISLILLLISSGLAVFLTTKNESRQKPTPSPLPQYQTEETISTDEVSASWKTYKDDTYKFELAVPKRWYMWATSGSKERKLYYGDTFQTQSFDPNEESIYDQERMKSTDKVKNPMRIDIGIDTANKNTLEDIKNNLIKNNGTAWGGESVFYNLEKVTETKLDSQPALSVMYKNKSIRQLYLLNEKNYLYRIDIYFDPTFENNKLLDQILSTFKFTN